MTAENYNFLNIEDTEERPYFFGLGFPSKFNCNQGFSQENFHDEDQNGSFKTKKLLQNSKIN